MTSCKRSCHRHARFPTRRDVCDNDTHEENAVPKGYLEVFSDADWAANKQTGRGISSLCVFFGTYLLHSSSRAQKLVSLSSGESETSAASSAACDRVLLRGLIVFCINKDVCTVHHLDSSVARGILQPQGVGRVRHMSCRVFVDAGIDETTKQKTSC